MYDHQTESLWLQVKREAVTGPMTGVKLKSFPSTITTWERWKKRYPKTDVLSIDTGHTRDYSRDPYESYYESRRGLFSFLGKKTGAKEKELVVGVAVNKKSRAYPLHLLIRKTSLTDKINGQTIHLQLDRQTDEVSVQADGEPIDHIITYWLVWHNIYPDTDLFRSTDKQGENK